MTLILVFFLLFILVVLFLLLTVNMAPRKSRRYRRLPGVSQWISVRTLWCGRDHLMAVDTTVAGESYRRFYFKDIQAVIVRRTMSFSRRTLLLGLFFFFPALFGILGLIQDENNLFLLPVLLTAGLLGVALLRHLWLGPTCAMHIQTTAGRELVPSVLRMCHARRIMDEIAPVIQAAQADGEETA